MSDRFRIHYGDSVTCENEKLYADMASQGWLLKKAGGNLSRFEKCSPRKLQYRVEPVSSDEELKEKIKSAYKKAGWEHAADTPGSCIFRAGEKKKAPEINYTEQEKTGIAKAVASDSRMSFIVAIAAALVIPVSLGSSLLLRNWLIMPEIPLMIGALMLKLVYRMITDSGRKHRISSAVRKSGQAPHGGRKVPDSQRYAGTVITAFFFVFFVLFLISLTGFRSYELQGEHGAPMISLSDMGLEGEPQGSVTRIDNVAARVWDIKEQTVSDGEESGWMQANVYRVNNSFIRNRIPSLLIKTAVFDNKKADYEVRETDGMDLALYGKTGIEFIGIKDKNVYYIVLGTAEPEDMPDPLELLGKAELRAENQ